MYGKILVAYRGKTGFTKRYAEWIAEAVGGVLMDGKQMTAENIREFDTIVYGGRCCAGRIDGWEKAKELFQKSNRERLLLFATGATPNTATEVIEQIWKNNLTETELSRIPHFYFQGGLCYEKMSLPDRVLMKLFASMMEKKKNKEEASGENAPALTSSYDISSAEYIQPLVQLLKKGV